MLKSYCEESVIDFTIQDTVVPLCVDQDIINISSMPHDSFCVQRYPLSLMYLVFIACSLKSWKVCSRNLCLFSFAVPLYTEAIGSLWSILSFMSLLTKTMLWLGRDLVIVVSSVYSLYLPHLKHSRTGTNGNFKVSIK